MVGGAELLPRPAQQQARPLPLVAAGGGGQKQDEALTRGQLTVLLSEAAGIHGFSPRVRCFKPASSMSRRACTLPASSAFSAIPVKKPSTRARSRALACASARTAVICSSRRLSKSAA